MDDSVDLPDIADFFGDILTFFHDECKIENSQFAAQTDPRGGAETGERS